MTDRLKWAVVALIAAVALVATAIVGGAAWQRYNQAASAAGAADTTTLVSAPAGDHVVFRNTASGSAYGHVASLPLDGRGARAVMDIACDRVAASADELSCLRSERGIVPRYSATLYTATGEDLAQWSLPGVPSRTRFSPDGQMVATTSFVSGHSYATIGFSTATSIRTSDGEDLGDLEEWTLIVDGEPVAPVDRNYWGVTFVDDSSFYATVGMSAAGKTHLVRGDLASRTLTTLADDVECPSLSPDGTRIAFKRVTGGSGAGVHWTPAVYDIATGDIRLLPEARGIDDQIEWLDDDTLLYGMPRPGAVGDSDVWRIAADGSSEPEIWIEHAWSPSVVRG